MDGPQLLQGSQCGGVGWVPPSTVLVPGCQSCWDSPLMNSRFCSSTTWLLVYKPPVGRGKVSVLSIPGLCSVTDRHRGVRGDGSHPQHCREAPPGSKGLLLPARAADRCAASSLRGVTPPPAAARCCGGQCSMECVQLGMGVTSSATPPFPEAFSLLVCPARKPA